MPEEKKTPAKKNGKQRLQTKLRLVDIAVALVTVMAVGFGLWRIAAQPAQNSRSCAQPGREHQVALTDDTFTPASISVNRCDRLVISNNGSQIYDLNLGTHENHITYPGFSGYLLRPGERFTFDALEAGSFPLHDHLRDNAKLQMNIAE